MKRISISVPVGRERTWEKFAERHPDNVSAAVLTALYRDNEVARLIRMAKAGELTEAQFREAVSDLYWHLVE